MPVFLSRYNADLNSFRSVLPVVQPALLPGALLVSSVCAYVGTPVPNSLLTSAIAWVLVCIYTTLRLRRNGAATATAGKRLAWAAGGLLSLGAVCERSVDGKGVWWAHVCKMNTTPELFEVEC